MEVETVDDAALLAVVERDLVEPDVPLDRSDRTGRRTVEHSTRHGERGDAGLDSADILKQRGDLPHDPLAHAEEAQHQRSRGRDRTGRYERIQPEPDADGKDAGKQCDVEQIELHV